MRLVLKTKRIDPRLRTMSKKLGKVPAEGHEKFVSVTPIRTGNARRKTRLQGSNIKADYPYAKRLDEGYSKQAPKGMLEPTIEFIRNRIEEILGK